MSQDDLVAQAILNSLISPNESEQSVPSVRRPGMEET